MFDRACCHRCVTWPGLRATVLVPVSAVCRAGSHVLPTESRCDARWTLLRICAAPTRFNKRFIISLVPAMHCAVPCSAAAAAHRLVLIVESQPADMDCVVLQ